MKFSSKPYGFYFILLLFIAAGFLSWSLYFKSYTQKDTVNIHEFPKAIGEWNSDEMTITDEEYAILETRNAFSRRYFTQDGREVYLFIVYSQNNRKVSHPPEICYTGAGATILGSHHDFIKTDLLDIKANRLTVEMGKDRQVVFYWFKVGDAFTANYWKQQGLIAAKSFSGQSASSALIRISSPVNDGGEEAAAQVIREFGSKILPEVYKSLP